MQRETTYTKRFANHPVCQRWMAEQAKYPAGWAAAVAADMRRDADLEREGWRVVNRYHQRGSRLVMVYDLRRV